jgi:hypothetical protein
VGFDDDFDGLLGLDNQLEPKTCLSQREAVGNHFTEGKALDSYQFNGPFNIRRAAPISRKQSDPIHPKIEEWNGEIDIWLKGSEA